MNSASSVKETIRAMEADKERERDASMRGGSRDVEGGRSRERDRSDRGR